MSRSQICIFVEFIAVRTAKPSCCLGRKILQCCCPQCLKVNSSVCLERDPFKCENQIRNYAGLSVVLQLLLELTGRDGIRRNESD